MGDNKDLELILTSRTPLLVIETHEERRAVELFRRLVLRLNKPLFRWAATEGLQRLDLDLGEASQAREPQAILQKIKQAQQAGIYLLLDFHPWLDDPLHVRLIKEIAQDHALNGHHLVLISHALELPSDLRPYAARFELSLPDADALRELIRESAQAWSLMNEKRKVKTDRRTLDRMVQNLSGLTYTDARRLIRKVIFDDGAISENDLPGVMQAKYQLLGRDGVLAFEYETEQFASVGGMQRLKHWLSLRKAAFVSAEPAPGLDRPKGILLLGVQGCGKSLAAKAVAGIFGLPLLRLDFGVLYNKYFGESEKNLREALRTADLMAPCVLWIDEIEKGLAVGDNDGGTSQRVLGSLLTWMAEDNQGVFLVATANDISRLPPELVRKGRFDELFFVDLPDAATRAEILAIHLQKRDLSVTDFDLPALAQASEGFSGAELEQALVAALYSSHAEGKTLDDQTIAQALRATQPLSVVMAERITALREWARGRTVPVQD